MGMFGTTLSAPKEEEYQRWRQALSPALQNEGDYDLRGAFSGNAQAASNGHLPDTYKLPNHITFSEGSQYSDPTNPGGQWIDKDGKWSFWASPANTQYHTPAQLGAYFKQYEPDASLILPSLGFDLRNYR